MKAPKKLIVSMILTAVVVASGGFYGGYLFGRSRPPGRGDFGQLANADRAGGAAMNRLRTGGANIVNGEILSKDDESITVKNRDGGSKIIFFTDSTSIGKTTDGTAADLEAGKTVIVTGTANSDGTVTAQNIQIRPAGSMPFGGPGGAGGINGTQTTPPPASQ